MKGFKMNRTLMQIVREIVEVEPAISNEMLFKKIRPSLAGVNPQWLRDIIGKYRAKIRRERASCSLATPKC